MSLPPLPEGRPPHFRSTVHGTCFGDRARLLDGIREGDELVLIPDPPGQDDPEVWVHLQSGDPLGHLPPEISLWMAPWLLSGGSARATVLAAHGVEVPSWRRLVVQVDCAQPVGG